MDVSYLETNVSITQEEADAIDAPHKSSSETSGGNRPSRRGRVRRTMASASGGGRRGNERSPPKRMSGADEADGVSSHLVDGIDSGEESQSVIEDSGEGMEELNASDLDESHTRRGDEGDGVRLDECVGNVEDATGEHLEDER
jgi:hypothetical protein